MTSTNAFTGQKNLGDGRQRVHWYAPVPLFASGRAEVHGVSRIDRTTEDSRFRWWRVDVIRWLCSPLRPSSTAHDYSRAGSFRLIYNNFFLYAIYQDSTGAYDMPVRLGTQPNSRKALSSRKAAIMPTC
jgi:hypothetical protein